ncbi:MAG TPA: hypothetical protein VL856_06600 [Acidimicrobiia bacterium]|jgi:hypothetical protein|nr:hypothetical protein [Acidimicrobiia bacterium]
MRESNQYVADPTVLRSTGVVALLGIGVIHFLQIVPTVQETPLLGAGYFALIATSLVLAAWLVVANDARAWTAAGLLSLVVLAGYAFTRLVGTTFDNQDVGNWSCMLGLASIFAEVSLLALSGSALALAQSKVSERSMIVPEVAGSNPASPTSMRPDQRPSSVPGRSNVDHARSHGRM